ncbi:transposase, partial [Kutzneria sp. NPDC052558]|uniref:transposase n=1 Tax=Kutzneria sp. NPDC052558 TaxID=3364121 RepID=UPI0037C501A9
MISVHETDPTGVTGAASAADSAADGAALTTLVAFRQAFHDCLTRRADALFELTDALLCAPGPVTSLVELSLAGEHRRGHGSLYDSLNAGRIDVDQMHNLVARHHIPRDTDGRIVLAIDVSNWLRPGADTSPERAFCHTYTRGRGTQMIPGWPYSFVAALEPGRSCWTALLHAQRLMPDDDATAVSAAQLRVVVSTLIATGQHRPGDPEIWVLADSGYHSTRLAVLLADLPVRLLVRMRADRVLRLPAPPPRPGRVGRPPRHGPKFRFDDVRTWSAPAHRATTATDRYGEARAQCWHRLHAAPARRDGGGGGGGRTDQAPVVEGTVIRVRVDRLPGRTGPQPMWLWCSDPE